MQHLNDLIVFAHHQSLQTTHIYLVTYVHFNIDTDK